MLCDVHVRVLDWVLNWGSCGVGCRFTRRCVTVMNKITGGVSEGCSPLGQRAAASMSGCVDALLYALQLQDGFVAQMSTNITRTHLGSCVWIRAWCYSRQYAPRLPILELFSTKRSGPLLYIDGR